MKFTFVLTSLIFAGTLRAQTPSVPATVPLTDVEAAHIHRLNLEYSAAQHQANEAIRHAQIYLQQLGAAHPGYQFDPQSNMLLLAQPRTPEQTPAVSPTTKGTTASPAIPPTNSRK